MNQALSSGLSRPSIVRLHGVSSLLAVHVPPFISSVTFMRLPGKKLEHGSNNYNNRYGGVSCPSFEVQYTAWSVRFRVGLLCQSARSVYQMRNFPYVDKGPFTIAAQSDATKMSC